MKNKWLSIIICGLVATPVFAQEPTIAAFLPEGAVPAHNSQATTNNITSTPLPGNMNAPVAAQTAAPPTLPPTGTSPPATMSPVSTAPAVTSPAAPPTASTVPSEPVETPPPSYAVPTQIPAAVSPAPSAPPTAALPAPSTILAAPPAEDEVTPAEAAQFQTWLQNNKQNVQRMPPLGKRIPRPPRHRACVMHVQTGPDAPLVESPPMSYERQKKIMLSMAPDSPIKPNPDSKEVFNSMLQQNMPLSPQQVVKLRQLIDTSQRAAAIPPTIPPKPVSTTLMINLAPGSTPPALRLAQGYISSLVFVDSTGAPWPIAAYDIGDPKIVNIQWDGKSNVLLLQAVSPYSNGNLVIRLVGLNTPVTLELVSGQRVVDYRTDIHVAGIGPNAKDAPSGTGLPESANQLLLSVLDGVAPSGSKQLTVRGGDCQAWLLNDKMYVRTRFTVLSPGWVGKMSSPDGMMAYEMQRTSSILVSQYGNPIELKVEGF